MGIAASVQSGVRSSLSASRDRTSRTHGREARSTSGWGRRLICGKLTAWIQIC